MDMRHRVYYAVNLNQNYKRFWLTSGSDVFGVLYSTNLKILKGAIRSLKCRELRHKPLSGGYFQMMISCKWQEEATLVDTLDQLKWVDYEKLDGKEWM